MKFNVTIMRPDGFLHSQGFAEVADSVCWSLSEIGHDVSLTQNWFDNDATNIIFGAELIGAGVKLPKSTIIYNLEQPSHPRMESVRRLAKGLTVWDYSKRNVEIWKAGGYDVRHVPIGYTPNLTRIPKAAVQDIDVLFYGFLTPRRVEILKRLNDAGLKVVGKADCYGGARDNLISRSKVVVNIHHDGRNLLEIVRVSYLMANKKCVVSELSMDDSEYGSFDNCISRVRQEEIVGECASLVGDSGARSGYEYTAFGAIEVRNIAPVIESALEPSKTNSEVFARVHARYQAGCRHGDMKPFMEVLRDHARGNILEIGVRDGASTAAFLLGLEKNGGHLTSIDINDCSHLFPGHPQWTFLQGDSHALWPNLGQFDALLIDGDHSRDGYLKDLEYFYPLVKRGGTIFSHDINPGDCTVENHPGSDYPSISVREEYFRICHDWNLMHGEILTFPGMGMMVRR